MPRLPIANSVQPPGNLITNLLNRLQVAPQDRGARAVPALGLEMALVECKLGKAPASLRGSCSGVTGPWAQPGEKLFQASLSRPIPRVRPGKGSSHAPCSTLSHCHSLEPLWDTPGAFSFDSLISSVYHQITHHATETPASATMSLGHQPCTAGPQQPPPSWCLNRGSICTLLHKAAQFSSFCPCN